MTSVDYGFLFGAARDDDAIQGYTVAPGNYGVLLTYGDVVQKSTVEVQWDPINTYDDQAIQAQQQFLSNTFSMLDAIYKRVESLQKIQKQVDLRKSIAKDMDDEALAERADALLEKLKYWQESVTTPNRGNGQDVLNIEPKLDAFLTILYGEGNSAVLGITQGQRDRLGDLEPGWNAAMQSWNTLVDTDVAEFSRGAGPAVVVPAWD